MWHDSATSAECKDFCDNLMDCEAFELEPDTMNCILHCPKCDQSDATSIGFTFHTGTSAGPIVKGDGIASFHCYVKRGSVEVKLPNMLM